MATLKLAIADPKAGKTYKKEIKDDEAKPFMGLNIGETIKGEAFGMQGYEFQITGGSDHCGFPMRRGVLGQRKRITLLGGVGFAASVENGIAYKKTVCGHKIHDSIVQVNLKVVKGEKPLADVLGATEAPAK